MKKNNSFYFDTVDGGLVVTECLSKSLLR